MITAADQWARRHRPIYELSAGDASALELLVTFQQSSEVAMNRTYAVTNAILWASAIIASAIVDAPIVLSAVLLPTLAICSLLAPRLKSQATGCQL